MESVALAGRPYTIPLGPGDASGYTSETSSVTSTSSRKRRHSEISRDTVFNLGAAPETRPGRMFGDFFNNIFDGLKRHFLTADDEENEENPESGTSTEDEADDSDSCEDRGDVQTPPPNESLQRTSPALHVSTDDDSASPSPQLWPQPHNLLVKKKTRDPPESQHQLPSPLPSEDEKAPSPKPSHAKTLQRLPEPRKSTVLANSILDARKPFYKPHAPPKRHQVSFNQALQLRDKHSADPRNSAKFRTSTSRAIYPGGTPYKPTLSSPKTPMGASLSRFGRSTASATSTARPYNPRSSIRRPERVRRVTAPTGVVKSTQKKPLVEFKRTRDSLYRRNNDPLMAQIELAVLLESKAQYHSSGLRTKQQVDQELEERNKLIQKLMKEKAAASQFAVPPLKPADQKRVQEIFSRACRQQSHTFCSKFRIDISGHDLVKLRPNEWLNDNLIDFYINLITEREKAKGRKVEGMTTHFFTTFSKNGYEKVARWLSRKTKEYCRKNIMKLDVLLVPINIGGSHWTLGVIAPKKKQVEFWNSLKSPNSHADDVRRYCAMLREYVAKEAGIEELDGWIDYSPEVQPQQNNFCDCGVFTVKTAEFRARDADPAYTPLDAKHLRERMVLEIVDGKMDPVGGEEEDDW